MDANAISGFSGDQSQQGQGLAYVLPQSRTTGYFMQLANEQAQQRRDDAALLAQQQQKANEQYAQHLYATKTPEIAKDYTQYLQPKFDDLLTQMADYHTNTGKDPYTNPDYIKQFNDLSTVAKNTHEANVQHTAYAAQLADKSKNYTPESKQAGIDWLNAYHKNPVSMLYSPPPALEQRNLDMNDAIKLGHPNGGVQTINGYDVNVPNRHGHIVQGQTILNQPEFAPFLQSRGINPTIGDIGGIPNGSGGTLYPTDAPHVNAIADQILQNAAQPHYTATLHAAGIDPLDPHAKDKLTEIIQRQNAGYGKVYGEFADRLDADIAPSHRQNLGEERLGLGYANLDARLRSIQDAEDKTAQKNAAPEGTEPIDDFPIQYNAADENGGFAVHAKNFVPLSSTGKQFAGYPDIDVTNGGKPTQNAASIKGSIAGVGDWPVFKKDIHGDVVNITKGTPAGESAIKAGNAVYKRMVLVEGKDEKGNDTRYLLDYNKLPANVKNSKAIKEALGTFDNTPVYGSEGQKSSATSPVNKHKKAATDYGL